METNSVARKINDLPEPFHRDESVSRVAMTPGIAKRYVLAHWEYLDGLCQRRFRHYPSFSHEALLFVLDGLQKDNWKRVRAWEGEGDFKVYISVLSSRLLIDFKRKKLGHSRRPQWLIEKRCPVWECAYRLLFIERYSRYVSFDQLLIQFPDEDPSYINIVIVSVLERIVKSCLTMKTRLVAEEIESVGYIGDTLVPDDIASTYLSPDSMLGVKKDIICLTLWALLDNSVSINRDSEFDIEIVLSKVRTHLSLCVFDYELLRLRFVLQLSVKEIVKMTGLVGDPYKRFDKIFSNIRCAFKLAGVDGNLNA